MPPVATTNPGKASSSHGSIDNNRDIEISEPHTMKSSRPSMSSDMKRRLVQQIWLPIMESKAHYVTSQQLKAFNIFISPMSFSTGRTHDNAPDFIELFPTTRIEEVLAQTQPWKTNGVKSYFSIDETQTNLWKARDMWMYFETLLGVDQGTGLKLVDQVDWTFRSPRFIDRMSRIEVLSAQWQADVIIERKDRSVPHRTCYLVDDAPLRENVLSMSELYASMATIAKRAMGKKTAKFQIIPTTIIIASGSQVRVTQTYPDFANQRLMVRMTRIVELAEGPPKKWNEIVRVLSWMLGSPVGTTT